MNGLFPLQEELQVDLTIHKYKYQLQFIWLTTTLCIILYTWTQIDVIISFDIIICFKKLKGSLEKCQPKKKGKILLEKLSIESPWFDLMLKVNTYVLYGSFRYSSSTSRSTKSLYLSTSFSSCAIFFASFERPITNLNAKPVACSNLQKAVYQLSCVRL